ncbi:MAG: quercetin 2,3-dioxygenase [Paucimonas sp.]|jgi:redox-sensitive bicupin YhaK (pirin superfamily)|nr:quercetin 2,3-dioxygenase [Paucimonas sp.]
MLELRRSNERGHAQHGWLDSHHSFSFADYYDPHHTSFGPLLVINEDRVQAGKGFGTHAHRDMEIISYVLEGELAHRDSMGNGSVLRPGDVQRMSAGTGVRHSEFNNSTTEPVHFLQIWLQPNVRNTEPAYEEKHFDSVSKTGRLRLIASPDGREGSLTIRQDALVHAAVLEGGQRVAHTLAPKRRAYVHVVRGSVDVNGQALQAGDAAKLTDEPQILLDNAQDAEVLLFDLP